MTLRLIGALLIVISCGGFGIAMSTAYKKEERTLKQFSNILDYFACELQYRLTPLPQLCRQAALECSGSLNQVFQLFAEELDMQLSADAERCMKVALAKHDELPAYTKELMLLLGHSLGRFDLDGQLKDLDHVHSVTHEKLKKLTANKEIRVRTYQTLGLCTGAALAILLL